MNDQPENKNNYPWTYPAPNSQRTETGTNPTPENRSSLPFDTWGQPVSPAQQGPTLPPPTYYGQRPQDGAPVPPEKGKKQKKGKLLSAVKVIALALCCSLLGSIAGGVIVGIVMATQIDGAGANGPAIIAQGDRESSVIDITTVDTSKVMTPAEVYATNVNSTVGITTSVVTNFWGYSTTSPASGSGFILSDTGYILTNYHVIEDSSSITVSFYDGSSMPADLIGYDINNDIAVLKVNATGLVPVILGDSENMNVGDEVVAIGNPLGELTFSLTVGAVSAMSREVTTSNGITMNLIQTDCAINSGNSGGALFNLYGEVIGITNAKYSSSSNSEASIDNIGFAIPVNSIKDIVQSIIEDGYITKPYVGISVADVSEESQSYGLPQGAAVKQIVPDSPAAASDLQINDIITHVNGEAVAGSSQLVMLVGESSPGDVLKLTVYRQGNTIEIDLTVGEKIQSALEQQESTQEHGTQQESSNGILPWPFGNYGY